MTDKDINHLEDISEIRSIMERSSRFISLSGLSGVFAGIWALAGAAITYVYFGKSLYPFEETVYTPEGLVKTEYMQFLIAIALGVLCLAVAFGVFFTTRKAKKQGLAIWGPVTKRLVISLAIPLFTGACFVAILLYHGMAFLAAPATLIFYGLALLNASKYTYDDIRYLGLSEIILGLVSSVYTGYSLLFWALGFGVLHIIYGIAMYRKYEG